MVAPTRAPQSRGIKCDLCKKILVKATWLDQTKPAKSVDDAQYVLDLIDRHNSDGCLCMPRDIENLLVGSTYFEAHCIIFKKLDLEVHKKQYGQFQESRRQQQKNDQRNIQESINDCKTCDDSSRFKSCLIKYDDGYHEMSKQQLGHLTKAIDYWRVAMEDKANPFNSKLALRLGLTHHVIYACYLFKYYHLIHYQLLAANLLLNIFRCIEGVTANAIMHASYLLVKTLIECDQLKLARQYLDQATKIQNYQDKIHYESILLTCAACELSILDGLGDPSELLILVSDLAVMRQDDKLQHYYSRTYAITLIIRYIHYYRSKSDLCFEFFHAFRYSCAIIRRCYENSFDLILHEKELQSQRNQSDQQNQIVDHSWIRFAVCDLVFSSFDLLSNFYYRAGLPESLELLHNGLDLISYRNGSYYWQCKLATIAAGLDRLCGKYDHSQNKLDVISRIVNHANDPILMNLLRLELEVATCELHDYNEIVTKEIIQELLQRIVACLNSHQDKISNADLYDSISNTKIKLNRFASSEDDLVVFGQSLSLRQLSLRLIKVYVHTFLKKNSMDIAKATLAQIARQISGAERQILEFYDCHILLEAMLYFCDIENSENHVLETVRSSNLFFHIGEDSHTLETRLSSLTISERSPLTSSRSQRRRPTKVRSKLIKNSRLKKATYEMGNPKEDLTDSIELLKKIEKLSTEDILVAYIKNSEPNPDYLLYRRAHELLFCIRLREDDHSHEQLLYHFLESTSSNTMRYRWMMFEEQQSKPHDRPNSDRCDPHLKQLGFNGSLINSERILKSLVKHVPEDWRLLQIKYIPNVKSLSEHLLMSCLDGTNLNEPIYIHSSKSVSSDDFFGEAEVDEKNFYYHTLPSRLSKLITESRNILLSHSKSRMEMRQKIENEIGILLHDMENDWLGPYRILLCGKSCDSRYNKYVQSISEEILMIMQKYTCKSITGMRLFLQNAPLINRTEFCKVLSSLFNCSPTSSDIRESFNRWLKSIESFIAEYRPDVSKELFVQILKRGQVGLILDKNLDQLPIESLPVVRILKQGIFRVPSVRIFNVIIAKSTNLSNLDPNNVAYILDPASNLSRTRERFEERLLSMKEWVGAINKPPEIADLEQWLIGRQIYIFIGHGAGSVYYKKLNKGHGLHSMSAIKPVSIVMGCSSSRIQAEGPALEPFGISWAFVFRGSPCYLGLLWDVTDTDIDRFLDNFLVYWIGSKWPQATPSRDSQQIESAKMPITDACARAKQYCHLKFLVGSTPVIYGLPVSF